MQQKLSFSLQNKQTKVWWEWLLGGGTKGKQTTPESKLPNPLPFLTLAKCKCFIAKTYRLLIRKIQYHDFLPNLAREALYKKLKIVYCTEHHRVVGVLSKKRRHFGIQREKFRAVI